MRLVDADELIKKFRRSETNTENENHMCSVARRMIKEEPTAFDVDEIVARIEEIKKKKYGACSEEDCDNCKYWRECWDGEMGGFLALDKVLEIIKGGVSDEKNNCGVVYPDNAR